MNFANQFPTEQVPIELLQFNIQNPRWNHLKAFLTQEAIRDYIFEHSYKTRILKKSIASVGLKQPLVVQKHGKHYQVWDGNTRLACLQAINAEQKQFVTIPCFVLSEKISEDQIEAWLESQHGYLAPKAYNSYNRLERIRHLYYDCKWSYQDIATNLGTSTKTIQRAVDNDSQHSLTREYIKWVEDNGRKDPSPWRKETFFRHALNYGKDWLLANKSTFFLWLNEGKFRNSNSIGKDFQTIVGDPKLSKMVEEQGFDSTLAQVAKPRA